MKRESMWNSRRNVPSVPKTGTIYLMELHTDLLLDLNILSRATQKYYDRQLQPFDLTYAQLPVLLMIYESEGITANQIVAQGQYDKGTVTKNVQKLESLGYIETVPSRTDKRLRHLYTTDRSKMVIARIYGIRRDWWNHLMAAIPDEQAGQFLSQTRSLVNNAIEASRTENAPLLFYRMDLLSVNDWPGKLSLVLHAAGCNFRCPGCADRSRVILEEDARILQTEDILDQIAHRKTFIDGVVIRGGEPFLQEGLISFLRHLRRMQVPVRLQTNGTFPRQLEQCLQESLVQEVSLQILNDPAHYAVSAGLKTFHMGPLLESIQMLKQAGIDWDAVVELNDGGFDKTDLQALESLIKDAPHVVVRNHEKSAAGIDPGLKPMEEPAFAKWKERLER